ncbi:MAG: DNA polymerase I [Proteobacteria bacterium]|nr:DNA polymerase I [Pseudomonadota bacterium]MDA1034142.1 DNA polymerase I [Pseudomonadota bacterium]
MKKILLIDGSSYLYRAYHALPDLRNQNNEPSGVIYGVLNMLKKTIEEFSSDYIVCVFDAKGKTFRNEIYSEYKANRPKMPDDLSLQIDPLKKAINAFGIPMLSIEGVEADDVIGTLATKADEQNMQVIISTGDKDLAQLVNDKITLINTMTNEKLDINGVINKFGIPPGKIIDYLTLIGDKSDNVPGVDKVGPKTALKWLDEFGSLDGVIQNHEKITGAVGTNLKDSLNWLATGKKLITIKKDVDINLDLEEFLPKDQNKEELRKIYQKYNFNSWLKKEFQPNSADEPAKTQESVTEFIATKNYSIVNTPEELELWIQKILKKGQCVIDTETDSLDFMIARLVGISLATDAGEACYIPLQHQDISMNQLSFEDTLERIKTITQNQNIRKIGQNIKYDMHVLKNYGLSFFGEIEDTMLMSYVLDSTESHGMDKLSSKHLSHECISFESIVGKGVNQLTFDQINISDAFTYAAEDADVTLQLYNLFHKKILKDDKAKYIYYQIEIPSLKTLFEIERNGVLISEKILQNQSQEIGLKIIDLESQAFKIAGQPFNLSSPKQLREILFDKIGITSTRKTPTGIPSTSEDVLEELSNIHPLPKVILEHRSLSKLKNTYTDKLPKMVNSTSGRIHTNYNQAVAITGRLASSEPNLQNIPIKTEEGRKVRKAFIAKQDALILSCDYSQIELRIMAHLSQDAGLIESFQQNEDIHKATASKIFNMSPADISSEQRRFAKVINFGLIYGMSAFGLAQTLNIDRNSSKNFIEQYFEKYPGVKNYMDISKIKAKDQGYVETIFGRKLWVPEINSSNGMRRAAAERASINAPMQGTAADLIKMAMNKVQNWLANKKLKSMIIMQVHDELVLEVPKEELDIIKKEVPSIMSKVASLDVPLIADIGSGINWDEAH